MPTATITTKGQVTIPKEVRDHLQLVAGDRLEFRVDERGAVTLRPARRAARELFAYLRRRGSSPASPSQMDEEVAEVVAEDDERIRQGG